MAYYTGQVNSFAELKTVIESAAVAAGWVLNSGVLSKSGAYIQLTTGASGGYADLRINGGTGQSGSSLLDAPAVFAKIYDNVDSAIVWPGAYHIHAFDGEIYCLLNYNVEFYQMLCFGISDQPGILGTGCWFHAGTPGRASGASASRAGRLTVSANYTQIVTNSASLGATCGSPPWSHGGSPSPSFIHHALDGGPTWFGETGAGQFLGISSVAALLSSLPSPLNEAHILLPVKCVLQRKDGGRTILLQHQHLRWMRIDNVLPGEVIEFGSERWKCYPWLAKSAGERDGGWDLPHSGTFGYAIRYDGP